MWNEPTESKLQTMRVLHRNESQMNLKELQEQVGEWSRQNFPKNEPWMPLLGVGEEVGELMHAHLKSVQGIRGTGLEHHVKKVDAVGDILIYLADYCERNGIGMEAAMEVTWETIVKKRNWKQNPESGT